MARGRFISNSISQSHKFGRLKTTEARLVYLMSYTHADSEGRVQADPTIISGVYMTFCGLTPELIRSAVADLHNVGLVHVYEAEGQPYMQFEGFHKHNKIRRDDDGNPTREANSEIPSPTQTLPDWPELKEQTPASLRTNSGPTPESPRLKSKGLRVKSEELSVKGEAARKRATPPQDHVTPEEAFLQAATTGADPTIQEHKVRDRIRKLAGRDFQVEHNHDIPRWSREHTPERVDELWEAARPENWVGTSKAEKRRVWVFEDLLNGDILPPNEQAANDPLAQYVEMGL